MVVSCMPATRLRVQWRQYIEQVLVTREERPVGIAMYEARHRHGPHPLPAGLP